MKADGALVCCQDLAVAYRVGGARRRVLSDVTCSVRPGELVGLMGQSGSGKTTLLHVLAGLDEPESGHVEWPSFGPPSSAPGRVTLAFQSPSLLPALDVAENVALPLVLAGDAEYEALAKAHKMLKRFGLDELSGQLPEELSGGQAQRMALVRALVTEPALLLCDEPTGQVDHETAGALLDALFSEVEARGTAVVIATHDPAIIEHLPIQWTISDGRLTV